MLCIINCQNVVIKYNTRVWREYLQLKYQIISRIINNIKKLLTILKNYFFLCIYKMYLISTQGYTNANVHHIKIRKTDEIWESMKDFGDGLGATNISDLVLKEIYGI